jgi:hypothetical protein
MCRRQAVGWDHEFESAFLQRRVTCEPDFLDHRLACSMEDLIRVPIVGACKGCEHAAGLGGSNPLRSTNESSANLTFDFARMPPQICPTKVSFEPDGGPRGGDLTIWRSMKCLLRMTEACFLARHRGR